MRIVIVGPAYPLRGGGISSFNERLARHFHSEGHDVDIYSFSLQYPNFLFPGKSQDSDETAPDDLNIYTKINSINPLNWFKVGDELRDKKYDLLIVRYWMPFFAPSLGTILRRVRKNKHTKIVCIADNIIPHEQRFGDQAMSTYFLKSIDACVTMSHSVMQDLINISAGMPAVLTPHPLYDNYGEAMDKSVARNKLNIDMTDRVILFFGFIRAYKGLDMLLEALASESLQKLGVKLLLAGEFYSDESFYRKRIKELGLEKSIYAHTHFISNSDVATYFCAADCVVLPYKSATQSGITQVAYHFDIPMIATAVGGLPELVEDGEVGWLVTPDVEGITSGISRFYKDPISESFQNNIRHRKKKYSWKVFGDQILSFVR